MGPTHKPSFLRPKLKVDYLCNNKSETSNVCNTVEGHCLPAMEIMHHHANGHFDWLISELQSVNPSRGAISVLTKKLRLSILWQQPEI